MEKEEKEFIKLLENSLKSPIRFEQFKKLFDETRDLADLKKFFIQKVKPSLKYNFYIGNSYNASIFISLLRTLKESKKAVTITDSDSKFNCYLLP